MFHVELCRTDNLDSRTSINGLEGPSFCPGSIESCLESLVAQNVPRETPLARQNISNLGRMETPTFDSQISCCFTWNHLEWTFWTQNKQKWPRRAMMLSKDSHRSECFT